MPEPRPPASTAAEPAAFQIEPPDTGAFLRPFNDKRLILYFESVHYWHGSIKFLGLPALKETSRDVPIGNLFVEPLLSPVPLTPDVLDLSDASKDTMGVLAALRRSQRLVVLGDPGTGKSTLLNWLCESFTQPASSSALLSALGPLVPLPMVLRELPVDADITWDRLREAFLNHGVAKRLRDHPDLLDQLLESGQAFVMLDGLDEIGNRTVRLKLRDAVWEGFRRYPRARWLLTSRIVGYEEAEFDVCFRSIDDSPSMLTLASTDEEFGGPELAAWGVKSRITGAKTKSRWFTAVVNGQIAASAFAADVLYAVPFDRTRIERFALNWHRQHESNPELVASKTADLLRAIDENEGIRRLARIPNLLTFMALVHRTFAMLPDGRALLYAKISEAYLETIDAFRKLPQVFSLRDKERWLSDIAFRMQLRRFQRTKEQKNKSSPAVVAPGDGEILVPHKELIGWLTESMTPKLGRGVASQAAETFLDYLGRRSGLLVPRGEGLYAFIHLSFQEYYAAWFIADTIRGPTWMMDNHSGVDESVVSLTRLREYAASEVWRETFLLLFECLADSPPWPTVFLRRLFDNSARESEWELLQPLSKAKDNTADSAVNLVSVLASVSVDPYSGLEESLRPTLWRACWRWEATRFHNTSTFVLPVVARLLTSSKHFQADAMQALGATAGLQTLSLDGCTAISDLAPLAPLTGLRTLSLGGCTAISDLAPLAPLTGLQTLWLAGCTAISDLAPLAALTSLESLWLNGCTAISDLAPLAALTDLQSLSLDGCTTISDLAPLAPLTGLRTLSLRGCTAISDLAPLAALTGLRILRLDGCTAIRDVSPLSHLKTDVFGP